MKALFTIVIIFWANTILYGQSSKKFLVNSSIPLNEQIGKEDQYLFSDFKLGHVSFKDFTSGDGLMNYNFLLDEFQFLGEKGEKLAIANPEKISSIKVDSIIFVYTPKGYFELLEKGKIFLLLKRKLKILETGKKSAFDQVETTSKVFTVKSVPGISGRRLELSQTTEVQITNEISYWFSDGLKYFRVNNKNIIKLLPKNKSEINIYLKKENIQLNKVQDMITLTKFCNSLP
jgi:hypothetical protein